MWHRDHVNGMEDQGATGSFDKPSKRVHNNEKQERGEGIPLAEASAMIDCVR